jgi:VanZ family protein
LNPEVGNPRGFRHWFLAWWPVAAWIIIITFESSPTFGADRTSGPLRWVWEHIFGPIGNGQWDFVHHYIRKSGHFVGYGMVGLAWLRAWRLTLPRFHFIQDALLAMLGTALVASSDEFHQSFLSNRTGLPSDVVLDCCGAITMLIVVYAVMRLTRPKKLAGVA